MESRTEKDRAENIDRAIDHYRKALEVHTPQAHPDQWAATQHLLGVAYGSLPRGNLAENRERAIDHYRKALEIHTRQAHPDQWANIQWGLGAAYQIRVKGDRAENIEWAIDHYGGALEVYLRSDMRQRPGIHGRGDGRQPGAHSGHYREHHPHERHGYCHGPGYRRGPLLGDTPTRVTGSGLMMTS